MLDAASSLVVSRMLLVFSSEPGAEVQGQMAERVPVTQPGDLACLSLHGHMEGQRLDLDSAGSNWGWQEPMSSSSQGVGSELLLAPCQGLCLGHRDGITAEDTVPAQPCWQPGT